jgi:hypothetical protein
MTPRWTKIQRAFCKQTCFVATNVRVYLADSRDCIAHHSPEPAALDLPSRWIGFYSARANRQLLNSSSWQDVLTIVLSARNPQLWSYYALMATLGSVIGGFVTYRLARKGGELRHVPMSAFTDAYQKEFS